MKTVKVISRSWGYVLKWINGPVPSWITSDDGTFCWYRRKKDAEKRAECYNKEAALAR